MFNRLRWISPVVIILIMTACGSRDETPYASEPDQVGDIQEDEAVEPTSEQQQASNSNLRCANPLPVEFGLGETIDGSIEDPFWPECFWVMIPEGLSSVSFELSGLSYDLNLAVGYGFLVTLQYHIGEFWRPAESGPVDEVLIIEDPKPGLYFISVGIAGSKISSPFTLGIHAEPETVIPASGLGLPEPGICAPPATEVLMGSTVGSEIIGKGQDPLPRKYFCVQIPDGMNSFMIELTGLDGDLEIFVRHTIPAEWMDRSRGGTERTVVIDNPDSGAYYIDIVGAYPGAGSPFTLSVHSP